MSQYNKITFPGSLLQPGFSIYIWEVVHQSGRYFYVGMTGDNFYPSARSAIHRLSGHFERNRKSTQNQMKLAVEEKEFNVDEIEIIMYHWALPGFKPWAVSLRDFKPKNLQPDTYSEYLSYKKRQKEILKLEKYVIKIVQEMVGKVFSLNKTSHQEETPHENYNFVIEEVKHILKN